MAATHPQRQFTDTTSGRAYAAAPRPPAVPRVGRTDISSSGPAYGVRHSRPGAASPTGGGSAAWSLANDPTYQLALRGINTSRAQNEGQFGSTRQGLIAAYGAAPAGLGFAVDQTTQDLARAGTLGGISTVANTTRNYDTQNADAAAQRPPGGWLTAGLSGAT